MQVNQSSPGDVDLVDLVLDGTDRPAFLWIEPGTPGPGSNGLRFSRWNGSTFTDASGTTAESTIMPGGAFNPNLALDQSDQPSIVWSNVTGGGGPPLFDIVFTHWMYPYV